MFFAVTRYVLARLYRVCEGEKNNQFHIANFITKAVGLKYK